MYTIFLSYRQRDTKGYTIALYDRLCQRYGEGAIFWDGRSVREGEDYEAAMLDAVRGSRIVVIVVGRDWLALDDSGRSRLHDANDAVRQEVEEALRCERPLLPVLIDGALMPSSGSLPPSIALVAKRNAIEIDAGRDFSHDVDRLMVRIDELLRPATPRPVDGIPRGYWGLIGSAREHLDPEVTILAHEIGGRAVKRGFALATSGSSGVPAVARAGARSFLSSKGIDPAPYLPALSPSLEVLSSASGDQPGRVSVLFMVGGSVSSLPLCEAALRSGIVVLPVPSTGEAPFIAWRRIRDDLPTALGGALSLPEFRRLTEILPAAGLAEIAVDLAERVPVRPNRETSGLSERTPE